MPDSVKMSATETDSDVNVAINARILDTSSPFPDFTFPRVTVMVRARATDMRGPGGTL